MSPLYTFLSGATMMGAFVGGLFFFHFWRRSRARFFLLFALSFALMGVERILLLLFAPVERDDNVLLYCFRLVSYALIFVAIWDKNRPPRN